MDLDVYAGTLTRYYIGDWDTVLQPGGPGPGEDLLIVRIGDNGQKSPNPVEIRERVLEWREWMNEEVDLLEEPLEWPEERDVPYFTDKLTMDAYGGLQLWAAYSEQPRLKRPVAMPEDWVEDPGLAASNADEHQSRYPQLLYAVDIWLPARIAEVFDAVDIQEEETRFGSVPALLEELEDLNARTWGADDATVELWKAAGLPADADLEATARFAFSVILPVVRKAAEFGLPMLLD